MRLLALLAPCAIAVVASCALGESWDRLAERLLLVALVLAVGWIVTLR